MKQLDRRALFASGAAAALLAATGVSAAPQRGGVLRAALSGASRSDSFDAEPQGLFMQTVMASVFDGLTEIAADGTLRGAVASRWENAGLVWRFELRDSVRFHDDVPLTSRDVVFSLRGAGFDARAVSDGPVSGVEITTSALQPNLPFVLAEPACHIVPAELARRNAGIGTGLYAVRKYDPGRHFIGDRVKQHWKDGEAGWFDRIDFVHFADPAVRAQALTEDLVDVVDLERRLNVPNVRPLPDATTVLQHVHHRIAVPAQVGRNKPLDDLRMAERWWMV